MANDGDEVTNGSDPNNDDTDGDGINDGDEVATEPTPITTIPMAMASTMLLIINGTDPSNDDSDGDGVNDGDELVDSTDPLNPDLTAMD